MAAIFMESLPQWLSEPCHHGPDHLLLTIKSQLWEANGCAEMGHVHLTFQSKRNTEREHWYQ